MRAFLDTNVLVYLFDRAEPAKREAARSLLAASDSSFVVSTQVLQEFYLVTTRKLAQPLQEDEAESVCRYLSEWLVVPSDARFVLGAIELARQHRLSFWDALVVGAAIEGRCDRLYTEDLNHGQVIEGVHVIDPFEGDARTVYQDEVHEPGEASG